MGTRNWKNRMENKKICYTNYRYTRVKNIICEYKRIVSPLKCSRSII